MTMAYYYECLLPIYIEEIYKVCINANWDYNGWARLQEDGDLSYGLTGKGDNLAK